jgi:hypothetical protein
MRAYAWQAAQDRAQVGGPLQYTDAGTAVQRAGWVANFALHMLLAKLLPALFSAPTGFIAARPDARARTVGAETFYADVVAKGERTTRNLWLLAAVAAVGVSKLCELW